MMCSVKDCEPSFSYHAAVSSLTDAESASTSPSPSPSIAKTETAPFASVVMTRSVKDSEPSFSYQAIESAARAVHQRFLEPLRQRLG